MDIIATESKNGKIFSNSLLIEKIANNLQIKDKIKLGRVNRNCRFVVNLFLL